MTRPSHPEVVVRLLLVAGFVLMNLWYPWIGLAEFVTQALVVVCDLVGFPVQEVGETVLIVGDNLFVTIINGCTVVEAIAGTLPWLWNRTQNLYVNIRRIVVFCAIMTVLNIVRLAAGFVAYDVGVSWFWAHEFPAAAFYVIWFAWLATSQSWSRNYFEALIVKRV